MADYRIDISKEMRKAINARNGRSFNCYLKARCVNCALESVKHLQISLTEQAPIIPFVSLFDENCAQCPTNERIVMPLTQGRPLTRYQPHSGKRHLMSYISLNCQGVVPLWHRFSNPVGALANQQANDDDGSESESDDDAPPELIPNAH